MSSSTEGELNRLRGAYDKIYEELRKNGRIVESIAAPEFDKSLYYDKQMVNDTINEVISDGLLPYHTQLTKCKNKLEKCEEKLKAR